MEGHKIDSLSRAVARVVIATMLAVLAGCGGPAAVKDGPPQKKPDLTKVKEPVPKTEPRSKYGNPPSYVALGRRYYVLPSPEGYVERGVASWYGRAFHGKRTSSGETFDMYKLTAAHRTLPLPSYVRVKNLDNGRSIVVRVNDRGPFAHERILDLSYAAAVKLDIIGHGTAHVEVRAIDTGSTSRVAGRDPGPMYLQVGAFKDEDNAVGLRDRLRRAGMREAGIQHADGYYRVRIGPLYSTAEVTSLSDKLGRLGLHDSRVVIPD